MRVATDHEGVSAHYDAVAAGYGQQYQRDELLTAAEYPANYFRLQILVNRLAQLGARRVYEVGVGEGTPLLALLRMGFEAAGCDIADAMVAAAQKHLSDGGYSPDIVQWADVEDSVTLVDQLRDGRFDAVIAAGVLPHVRSDDVMLQNVRMLLRSGGTAFIEFRNALFSLFTLNRYTKEFILDELLRDVSADIRAAVASDLQERLAVDLPPTRERLDSGAPAYDAILARFHNPFELLDTFGANGFRDCRIHWYHYHPAPPMLEDAIGPAFREQAIRMEHETSGWRGFFLCSAGVVEATLDE
jgi:2-polyprenyl-3-methyl-5-hydroxy-6-metoxy-1,4-benzoquinol methylase